MNNEESTMTEDYRIYQQYKDTPSSLVYAIFEKYRPLISKASKKYAFNSGGRIDQEDFASDVYERLYYYVKYIKPEKINPETFMFHIYVKYSISKVLANFKEVNTREFLNIDDDNHENAYVAPETTTVYSLNLESYYAQLTERQRKVLGYLQKGFTYIQIHEQCGWSYGTVVGDINRAKQLAKDYF